VALLRQWSNDHNSEVEELHLVGSHAQASDCDTFQGRSDVDILVLVRNEDVTVALLSTLAAMGIENLVLFHPVMMTASEKKEKAQMPHYKAMLGMARKIFPEITNRTSGPDFKNKKDQKK
jgi:hypothetical protein